MNIRKSSYQSQFFGTVFISTFLGRLAQVSLGNDFEPSINPIIPLDLVNKPEADIVSKVLDAVDEGVTNSDIPLFLFGTDFQKKVWRALTHIPSGKIISYKELAQQIGMPTAYRAVANAIGANPIAVVIPCHRVIRSDGNFGGYRWGADIKKSLLIREAV